TTEDIRWPVVGLCGRKKQHVFHLMISNGPPACRAGSWSSGSCWPTAWRGLEGPASPARPPRHGSASVETRGRKRDLHACASPKLDILQPIERTRELADELG